MIWVLTIKHTGTHYLFDGLEQMGLSQAVMDIGTGNIEPLHNDFVHAHIDEESHRAYERADRPMVVTIRNPIDVYKTFCKKRRGSVEFIIEAFNKWDAIVSKFDPFIFHINGHDPSEFERLAKFLGVRTNGTISIPEEKWHSSLYPFEGKVPQEIFELARQYGY